MCGVIGLVHHEDRDDQQQDDDEEDEDEAPKVEDKTPKSIGELMKNTKGFDAAFDEDEDEEDVKAKPASPPAQP